MRTLTEIAQNLGVAESSEIANKFYKEQYIAGKYVSVKKGYISIAQNKELKSLNLDNSFCLSNTEIKQVELNKKRFSEILSSAITLDQAYELSK